MEFKPDAEIQQLFGNVTAENDLPTLEEVAKEQQEKKKMSPRKKTETVQTAPATPVQTAPATPVQTAPATPVQTAPATPVQTAPEQDKRDNIGVFFNLQNGMETDCNWWNIINRGYKIVEEGRAANFDRDIDDADYFKRLNEEKRQLMKSDRKKCFIIEYFVVNQGKMFYRLPITALNRNHKSDGGTRLQLFGTINDKGYTHLYEKEKE